MEKSGFMAEILFTPPRRLTVNERPSPIPARHQQKKFQIGTFALTDIFYSYGISPSVGLTNFLISQRRWVMMSDKRVLLSVVSIFLLYGIGLREKVVRAALSFNKSQEPVGL